MWIGNPRSLVCVIWSGEQTKLFVLYWLVCNYVHFKIINIGEQVKGGYIPREEVSLISIL